jgi:hypothetical protein
MSAAWSKAALPVLQVPRAVVAPRMDADLADAAWKNAAFIPALTLSQGKASADLVPLATRVLVLWSAEYLYVRFVCEDDEIYAPLQGHDAPLYEGDAVEVFIDARGDARQFIEVEVAPNDSVFDALHLLTSPAHSDADGVLSAKILACDAWSFPEWNLDGLRTATGVLARDGKARGWIADIALPAAPLLKRLGKTAFAPLKLRANFLRYDHRLTSNSSKPRALIAMNWSPVAWGRPHRSPQRMGFLKLKP